MPYIVTFNLQAVKQDGRPNIKIDNGALIILATLPGLHLLTYICAIRKGDSASYFKL
jgi:hypothetical protein